MATAVEECQDNDVILRAGWLTCAAPAPIANRLQVQQPAPQAKLAAC
jgi:hypothetical protein